MISSRSILAFCLLTCLFATASFMVLLTRGRSPFWIRRKLRLGAMILSLTTVAVGAQGCPPHTCYAATPNPYLFLAATEADEHPGTAVNVIILEGAIVQDGKSYITVSRSGSEQIQGTVSNISGNQFSAFVVDSTGTTLQSLDLLAEDGAFDSAKETFAFNVDGAVVAGTYRLLFFANTAAQVVVAQDTPLREFVLHVEP